MAETLLERQLSDITKNEIDSVLSGKTLQTKERFKTIINNIPEEKINEFVQDIKSLHNELYTGFPTTLTSNPNEGFEKKLQEINKKYNLDLTEQDAIIMRDLIMEIFKGKEEENKLILQYLKEKFGITQQVKQEVKAVEEEVNKTKYDRQVSVLEEMIKDILAGNKKSNYPDMDTIKKTLHNMLADPDIPQELKSRINDLLNKINQFNVGSSAVEEKSEQDGNVVEQQVNPEKQISKEPTISKPSPSKEKLNISQTIEIGKYKFVVDGRYVKSEIDAIVNLAEKNEIVKHINTLKSFINKDIRIANEYYLTRDVEKALLQEIGKVVGFQIPKNLSGREGVRLLQKLLKELGYTDIKVDGIFGPQTFSYLIDFQKTNTVYRDLTLADVENFLQSRGYNIDIQENNIGGRPDGIANGRTLLAMLKSLEKKPEVFSGPAMLTRDVENGRYYLIGPDGEKKPFSLAYLPPEIKEKGEQLRNILEKLDIVLFLLSALQNEDKNSQIGEAITNISQITDNLLRGEITPEDAQTRLMKILRQYFGDNEEMLRLFNSNNIEELRKYVYEYVREEVDQYTLVTRKIVQEHFNKLFKNLETKKEIFKALEKVAEVRSTTAFETLIDQLISQGLIEQGYREELMNKFKDLLNDLNNLIDRLREEGELERLAEQMGMSREDVEEYIRRQYTLNAAKYLIFKYWLKPKVDIWGKVDGNINNISKEELDLFSDIEGIGLLNPSDKNVDISKLLLETALIELAAMGVGMVTAGAGSVALHALAASRWANRLRRAYDASRVVRGATWVGRNVVEGTLFYQGTNLVQNIVEGRDWLEGADDLGEIGKTILLFAGFNGLNRLVSRIPGLRINEGDNLLRRTIKLSSQITLEGIGLGALGGTIDVVFSEGERTPEMFIEGIIMAAMLRLLGYTAQRFNVRIEGERVVVEPANSPPPSGGGGVTPRSAGERITSQRTVNRRDDGGGPGTPPSGKQVKEIPTEKSSQPTKNSKDDTIPHQLEIPFDENILKQPKNKKISSELNKKPKEKKQEKETVDNKLLDPFRPTLPVEKKSKVNKENTQLKSSKESKSGSEKLVERERLRIIQHNNKPERFQSWVQRKDQLEKRIKNIEKSLDSDLYKDIKFLKEFIDKTKNAKDIRMGLSGNKKATEIEKKYGLDKLPWPSDEYNKVLAKLYREAVLKPEQKLKRYKKELDEINRKIPLKKLEKAIRERQDLEKDLKKSEEYWRLYITIIKPGKIVSPEQSAKIISLQNYLSKYNDKFIGPQHEKKIKDLAKELKNKLNSIDEKLKKAEKLVVERQKIEDDIKKLEEYLKLYIEKAGPGKIMTSEEKDRFISLSNYLYKFGEKFTGPNLEEKVRQLIGELRNKMKDIDNKIENIVE